MNTHITVGIVALCVVLFIFVWAAIAYHLKNEENTNNDSWNGDGTDEYDEI